MLIPAPGNETPDLRHIHFYDPQTRILTELEARVLFADTTESELG